MKPNGGFCAISTSLKLSNLYLFQDCAVAEKEFVDKIKEFHSWVVAVSSDFEIQRDS